MGSLNKGDPMIPFNVPPYVGTELRYVSEAVEANHKICGDGPFTKRCNEWLEGRFGAKRALLTTSGTSALEMAALLCGIEPGDEVVLPSYTFSSTANAFVLAGARLVFVDVRPDTMNIDERAIEAALTSRTKAICVVHYAGVACEMDAIMAIAHRHGLKVVEDAAQAVMSTYHGRPVGTIGDYGCLSFHETKNYSMGEGGAILINHESDIDRAEVLREKGTNRSMFFRGQVDKYTWVDYGSSYLPSDINAAYLWAQLLEADRINDDRLASWDLYHELLAPLAERGLLEIPGIPDDREHNGHMFWAKVSDIEERTSLISYLGKHGIGAVFHYIPLHSAPAGLRFGRFEGKDRWTTHESERLLRLPLWYGLTEGEVRTVVGRVTSFLEDGGRA